MSAYSADDHRHMARALRLAARGLYTTRPNPCVGCVLVRAGAVVGEGWHQFAGGPHAEVVALNAAGDAARGATAYVTLEPCCHHGRTPPCTEALLAAGITRVVAAMEDPNPKVSGQGLAHLHEAGVAVSSGLMAAQAGQLNPGFIKRMQQGLPLVRVKLGMSLDGRTAMASGESQWITSPAAREDVQRLRARSCAVLTGSGTVLADDPALTVRLADEHRPPLRVVVDSRLRVSAAARVLRGSGQCLIATAREDAKSAAALGAAGVEIEVFPSRDGRVDLPALMRALAARGINEVLVESGPVLAGALLQADLVDELVIYLAPKLMGDAARGLFSLPGLDRLADAVSLAWVDWRAVGPDMRITARVTRP